MKVKDVVDKVDDLRGMRAKLKIIGDNGVLQDSDNELLAVVRIALCEYEDALLEKSVKE
jgi:hypothetical protein